MADNSALPPIYLRLTLITLLLVVGLCLALNRLVDPLWHFSGNRLTGQNMGFNERLSKLNRGLRVAADKNCVIYGSSRGTLLDESFFPNDDCLNMAVSEGLAEEFPLYAQALVAQGLQAQLLIINADDLSFFSPPGASNAPAFLKLGQPPPAWWQDYLSLDALEFSLRALAGKSPTPRFYQADFSITIEQGRRTYRPQDQALVALDAAREDADQGRRAHPQFVDYYRALIAQHPQARVVIYVPPISIWRLGDMIRRGELPDYLDSVYALRQLGHPVLDYSVPSPITSDPAMTYDGSHYNLQVNQQIAVDLRKADCTACLAVHQLSQADYVQQFKAAYRHYRRQALQD